MSLDRYYTPPHVARVMVELLDPAPFAHILEPSCGEGALLRALDCSSRSGMAYAFDIDPAVKMCERAANIANFLEWPVGRADACIMNPPFHKGLDLRFVVRALEWSPIVVALLRDCTTGLKGWHEQVWSKHTITDRIYCGRLIFDGPDAVAKKGKAKGKRVNSHHSFMIVRIERGRRLPDYRGSMAAYNAAHRQQRPLEQWLYDIEASQEKALCA
jgi:predicted RNA methylase